MTDKQILERIFEIITELKKAPENKAVLRLGKINLSKEILGKMTLYEEIFTDFSGSDVNGIFISICRSVGDNKSSGEICPNCPDFRTMLASTAGGAIEALNRSVLKEMFGHMEKHTQKHVLLLYPFMLILPGTFERPFRITLHKGITLQREIRCKES